jgi:hypothetical protein
MLQREIITVTDVFEKYNIENIFFYILLLYVKMTFCPAGTYFLHKLNFNNENNMHTMQQIPDVTYN